jgi:hypothetical protein
MALFKINKGAETNLPATLTEGWAYFCTDTGNFWIDHKDASDTLVRSKISAQYADKLRYINNENATIEINPAEIALLPKSTTVTLKSSAWTGSTNPYSQKVSISGVTANSKVDIQPTVTQIVELQNKEIALMIENNNGTTTAYAIGGKPTKDYTMQVLITEVQQV